MNTEIRQNQKLSILERTQKNQGRGSESFEPKFSSALQKYSSKLDRSIKQAISSYKRDKNKFGGNPFPWE